MVKMKKTIMAILVGLLVLNWGPASSLGAKGLLTIEADGYLQWLHSLEMGIKGRTEAGQEEGNLLFPFDLPGWEDQEIQPYRHLAISKALEELESKFDAQGRELSPLAALSNARNYINLSEYDSALVWYEIATTLDTTGNFRREIGMERLASATAALDSMAAQNYVTNTLGTSELVGREGELVLAYRWLLTQQDTETLSLLIKKTEDMDAVLTDRIRFWMAYTLSWQGENEASLNHFLKLIRSGGLSRDLTESQRSWVLAAIPDLFFLQGDTSTCRDLYEIIADSSLEQLGLWATFRMAGLDFLDCRYLKASHGFKSVCDGKRFGSWQDHACEMAGIAQEIHRIRKKGEPYGTDAFFTP